MRFLPNKIEKIKDPVYESNLKQSSPWELQSYETDEFRPGQYQVNLPGNLRRSSLIEQPRLIPYDEKN